MFTGRAHGGVHSAWRHCGSLVAIAAASPAAAAPFFVGGRGVQFRGARRRIFRAHRNRRFEDFGTLSEWKHRLRSRHYRHPGGIKFKSGIWLIRSGFWRGTYRKFPTKANDCFSGLGLPIAPAEAGIGGLVPL